MGKGYPCLSTAAGCSGVLAQDTAVYYHGGGKAQAKLDYGQVGRLSHSTATKEPEQVLRIIIIIILGFRVLQCTAAYNCWQSEYAAAVTALVAARLAG